MADAVSRTADGGIAILDVTDARDTSDQLLIAQRGVVYMPFMPNVMKRLYGSAVGGSVPVFEMQPKPAIRLYIDEDTDCDAFAKTNLKRMFG